MIRINRAAQRLHWQLAGQGKERVAQWIDLLGCVSDEQRVMIGWEVFEKKSTAKAVILAY